MHIGHAYAHIDTTHVTLYTSHMYTQAEVLVTQQVFQNINSTQNCNAYTIACESYTVAAVKPQCEWKHYFPSHGDCWMASQLLMG